MKSPVEKMYAADLVHPRERESMLSCQKNLMYNLLAEKSSALVNRLDDRAEARLKLYPVTKYTARHLNELYELALERLSCKEKYPLYIKFDYAIKAEISGSDSSSYIIMVSSAAMYELSDEEMLALLGQVLGRIQAGHVQNLQLLDIFGSVIRSLPTVGAVAEQKFLSTFAEWIIAAQFTKDRAAFFACGSEQAVASLILKQNGLPTGNLKQILNQRVKKSNSLGIYFIWLMKSLSNFGGVERIQELHSFICSDEFKKTYPGLYYKNLLENENADAAESSLLNLHKAAVENDVQAIMTLANKYFVGDDLPRSAFMAENFYRNAAFLGDACAMYIYSQFLKKFHPTISENFIRRLQEASASRGYEPARKIVGNVTTERFDKLVGIICADVFSKYKNQAECQIDFSATNAEETRAAFWMNADEKIFAQEVVYNVEGNIFGIAVTASGIYGRIDGSAYPYHISWEQFRTNSLNRRQLEDEKRYLTVGETALYRVDKVFEGTMAEIIIRLAASLKTETN